MTTSATHAPAARTIKRPNPVAVGTIVWLGSEVMFFAGLFAIYFTLRSTSPELWADRTEMLNVPYALVNTLILVASSFTCQMGVFAAEQGDVFGLRRWYTISAVMGTVFLIGQTYEYTFLYMEGVTISSSVYGSVFFITTGFHGLHVLAGVIAFVVLIMRTTMSRFTPAQATAAIVVSYYWHFVDVVWIGLFVTIYFIQ